MKKIILLWLIVIFLLSIQALVAEEIVQTGKWSKIDYKVDGTWKIIKKTDGNYLVLDHKFKTKSGPDLHLLFAKIPIADLTNSNASSNSQVIARLKSHKGYQEYKIPKELTWKNNRAIIIHCVRFAHLWAGANLTL